MTDSQNTEHAQPVHTEHVGSEATLPRDEMRAALPSWADGDALTALLDALEHFTSGPTAVPTRDRLAALDNDGTTACEKPHAMASEFLATSLHTDRHEEGHPVLTGLAKVYPDITPVEYQSKARAFLATNLHPDTRRPWPAMVYAPMLELIDLLQRLDFTVVMATDSSRDLMRVMSRSAYHLDERCMIGSEVELEWHPDTHELLRTKKTEPRVDENGKPAYIWAHTGALPLIAAGNTKGDIEMLHAARFALLVDHDDAEREYEYHDDKALAAAREHDWTIVSMRRDFAELYQPE